jgi:peptide-methionine (S)-S-oxide reductase
MLARNLLFFCLLIGFAIASCANQKSSQQQVLNNMNEETITTNAELDTATFGGGCFWCVEAVFQQLEGVAKVVSGYAGGKVSNPTYKEICTGRTGHAEVCQIIYDPQKITYTELLQAFFSSHDPTTLNRQGADVGTQYRSVIMYHTEAQKREAQQIIKELNAKVFDNKIVTELTYNQPFYKAEDYHQNYYNLNPEQSYCSYVITPKLEKFRKVFKDKLKKKS